MYNSCPMVTTKANKGGMPMGRRKRGFLGPEPEKIEAKVSPEEKQLIRDAAAYRKITISQYCAEAAVRAAKADLSLKMKQ